MGCWNATCNVSRLPIFCGDEIVVIPLIAVSATVTANTSYATDNFVPFSFPIVGKYNDYGGIEDAVITEENDKLIRSYEFYKSNGDGTAPYKVEIGDDMEKFISEELCGSDAYFIGCLFAADIFAETHRIFRRVQLRKPVQCRIP